jgi:cardiolipin synthase A/B
VVSEVHIHENGYDWLTTGDEYYAALLAAISAAHESIRLETYIFAAGAPGDDIRVALVAAAHRGVKVKVLADAFGSLELQGDYWNEFVAAGGEHKMFNALHFHRISFRDHRKLLVCDSRVAIVGGFNITGEQAGDGVTRGWRDLGLRLTGKLVAELEASFDRMFKLAELRHGRLLRLRQPFLYLYRGKRSRGWPAECLLTSGPGRWISPIKKLIKHDLKRARSVRLISAYFLPSYLMIRALRRVARRGGDVQIITAGKTDVKLARFAGRSVYHRLLHSRIHVFEYDAQVLHSKLIVIDDVVYVGSANMDSRSMNINYELLVRIEDRRLADEARRIFDGYLPHCRVIEHGSWPKSRSVWEKLAERFARFVLAYLDTRLSSKLSKLR